MSDVSTFQNNRAKNENLTDEKKSIQKELVKKPDTPNTKTNSEVCKDRFCINECENYQRPGCPRFTQKIPKDFLMPLNCYGYKPLLPTKEDA